MRIGLIGLGKMGSGMAARLVAGGVDVVGLDLNPESRAAVEKAGAATVDHLSALLAALPSPRTIWVMLPAGKITRSLIAELSEKLEEGDLVVDGGNSDFRDVPGHVETLGSKGIRFADIGVSGGQWGRDNGYGLMVGSSEGDFENLKPALDALSANGQYSRVGEPGSGHLVKAIHNGVQYGLMQAYAEGFAVLAAHPEVDVVEALAAWQGGSSVRSWLLEQMVEALRENPTLEGVEAIVPDSGMGRWTAEESIRLAVPTPVLSTALHARFSTQSDGAGAKLIAAARSRVGGQK